MPNFKRFKIADARQAFIGKYISYTFSRTEPMKTFLITEVKFLKGFFYLIGADDKIHYQELQMSGILLEHLDRNKQAEVSTDSEVNPYYAKYVLNTEHP